MMSTLKEHSNPKATLIKNMGNIDPPSNDRTAQNSDSNRSDSSKHGETHATCYIWMISAFAAIGGFLFGYDTGVVSGAMLLLKDEFSLSSYMQEIIVSSTIGAAFVFALIGGFLNDIFGRKVVTIIASFVFTVGAVLLAMAQNVIMLIIGRSILGIGIGKIRINHISSA